MNIELLHELELCETDVQGALERFGGNKAIYRSYLNAFTKEPTMAALSESVANKAWEDAFIQAHALKGLAANLGFIPLYHAVSEMIILLRAKEYGGAVESMHEVLNCYSKLIAAISCSIKKD